MPICLAFPTEPYDLDFPHEVTVTVRPMSGPLDDNARRRVWEMMEGDDAELKDLGLDLSDERQRNEAMGFLFLRELAVNVFLGWDQVLDAEGRPVACAPEAVRQFMAIPGMANHFSKTYLPTYSKLVMEGNASPPLQNGNSAGAGAVTVKTAKKRSSPARKGSRARTASSAPTGGTA